MLNRASALTISLAIVFYFGVSSVSTVLAQVSGAQYQGLFLVGRFGEVCTMCEVVVLCERSATIPDYETTPTQGQFTLYHLQTRTFWSQMATIWEFFVANFSTEGLAQQGHTRPTIVYAVSGNGWEPAETIESRLVLDPPQIEFGTTWIDRTDQSWRSRDDALLGYCERMPLWESIERIEVATEQRE